jgi:hypothetical protein
MKSSGHHRPLTAEDGLAGLPVDNSAAANSSCALTSTSGQGHLHLRKHYNPITDILDHWRPDEDTTKPVRAHSLNSQIALERLDLPPKSIPPHHNVYRAKTALVSPTTNCRTG